MVKSVACFVIFLWVFMDLPPVRTHQTLPSNSTPGIDEYTPWSMWSRCSKCIERRMKMCVSDNCEGAMTYQERPCRKKRCKRKSRQEDEFHVVHLNEDSSYLIKQAPSDIWSKWSKWSPCTQYCKTYRFRRCRRNDRCGNDTQSEEAYCYHEHTNCELYVLNLMENNRRINGNRWFEYGNDRDVYNPPKKKKQHKCGMSHPQNRFLRIVGGRESEKYKWPWHVAIINQHREVFCGGTLISPRWVLTANHCIRRYLRVRLNAHDLRATDGSDIEMQVYKIIPHPKFDYRTVDNDIAMLMLPRIVDIPYACLPNKRPKPGKKCFAVGWGKIDPEHSFGIPILHEAKLPIVSSKICKKSYRQFLISDNMLCAGYASGSADTCAGDSGGGLVCLNAKKRKNHKFKKNHNRRFYNIQGITSFGDGCGRRNKYGIYTMVFNYIGWIHYIINHYS